MKLVLRKRFSIAVFVTRENKINTYIRVWSEQSNSSILESLTPREQFKLLYVCALQFGEKIHVKDRYILSAIHSIVIDIISRLWKMYREKIHRTTLNSSDPYTIPILFVEIVNNNR